MAIKTPFVTILDSYASRLLTHDRSYKQVLPGPRNPPPSIMRSLSAYMDHPRLPTNGVSGRCTCLTDKTGLRGN